MSIVFRKAELSSKQYLDCVRIRKEVFVHEQNVPIDMELEHEEESHHYLVLLDGEPAGTGRLRLTGNKVKFERIATLKAHRGKGLGRALMKHLVSESQRLFAGMPMIMNSQASALSFYESLGWEKVSEESFYEAGIEHFTLFMRAG